METVQSGPVDEFRHRPALAVVRPRDDLTVQRMAFMFTDLRGSTALYQRVGDVAAFRLVQALFEFVGDTVRNGSGQVVKTTGDGVMAVFAAPVDAVQAALDLQGRVADLDTHCPAALRDELAVRVGLHVGHALAMRQDGGVDYFGSAVNLAAGMLRQSRGGDVVLSYTLWRAPGVAAAVGAVPGFDEVTVVKGFGPVVLRRLAPVCAG